MSLADLSVRHRVGNSRTYNFFSYFFPLHCFSNNRPEYTLTHIIVWEWKMTYFSPFPSGSTSISIFFFSQLYSGSDKTPPIYRQYPVCNTSCSQKPPPKEKRKKCWPSFHQSLAAILTGFPPGWSSVYDATTTLTVPLNVSAKQKQPVHSGFFWAAEP